MSTSMTKQQLAAKIWNSANKMRGKIEAGEYKDFILSFIFYKYLSDKEENFLTEKAYWDKADFKLSLNESDPKTVKLLSDNLGYFISYENLFSTWYANEIDFSAGNITTAISAFNRNINPTYNHIFSRIFQTLSAELSKLGDSASQTKAVRGVIELIKDIPMDGGQDYDVLGFVYEYLIGNFAANAGKKAGEFYTPHEVSRMMSEIVAFHLKGRNKISIYDPTSGSGSLLITIGQAVSKYLKNQDEIKYYGQELIEATYNLTRMNLVMRGILPGNIVVRNGDTLAEDWPYFEEENGHIKENTYDPLWIDAVVSNPPYSQKWNPLPRKNDPRFNDYGIAPKGKADYAFLLHSLYHLKNDGIMAIVLPQGVLFRGHEEANIRKHLVEKGNIDTIIGLPANIFFGTTIATIVVILQKHRENKDILFIDASKGFVKDGKKNKLRESDIKKIVETHINRKVINRYSRSVPIEEIRDNDYNLNIPRYVDSSEAPERWDIYSTMFGTIPNNELDTFGDYWIAFPSLRNSLLSQTDEKHSNFVTAALSETIEKNKDVAAFRDAFSKAFLDFDGFLETRLLTDPVHVDPAAEMEAIDQDLQKRTEGIPLVDRYQIFQILSDNWSIIATDLELIKRDGFLNAAQKVNEKVKIEKKDDKDIEKFDGYEGNIIPFELVQKTLLKSKFNEMGQLDLKNEKIDQEILEIADQIEDKSGAWWDDDSESINTKELANAVEEIFDDYSDDTIEALQNYISLIDSGADAQERVSFSSSHFPEVFKKIPCQRDGTFLRGKVLKEIASLQRRHVFEADSQEAQLIEIQGLYDQQKAIRKSLNSIKKELEAESKSTIESLSESEAKELLSKKWISPFVSSIGSIPTTLLATLIGGLSDLKKKYSLTFVDTEKEVREAEEKVSLQIDDLVADSFDEKGLQELKSILMGGKNGKSKD
jgi:type I restriction enzyme M protein